MRLTCAFFFFFCSSSLSALYQIPVLLVTSSAGMLLTPGTTVRQTPAAADADALIATRLALLCSDPHVTPALLATFCANHPRAWAVNAVAAESAAAAASAAAATSSGAGGRASSPSVVSSPSAVSALHALVSNPSFSLALFEAAAAAAAAEGSRDPNLGNAGGGDAGGKEQQQLPRLLCHLATITDSLHPLGRLPLHGLASNSHALLAADVAGQAYELVDAVAALYPNALHTAVRKKKGGNIVICNRFLDDGTSRKTSQMKINRCLRNLKSDRARFSPVPSLGF